MGFSKIVHGGLIATLLDEVMVWACAVGTKRFAFCAEFAVRFQKPLRPDEEVQVVGELVADRKRIFEAKAELRTAGGAVVASATGKYMPIKEKDTRQMAADFVQGSANLFFGTSPSA